MVRLTIKCLLLIFNIITDSLNTLLTSKYRPNKCAEFNSLSYKCILVPICLSNCQFKTSLIENK